MAEKYPEIRRVSEDGIRARYGERHNNCFSSPIYREKVTKMDTLLAKRYSSHPGVVLWHLSNEYNTGDCYCELCRVNFRSWLEKKYGTIENLNNKWWNGFWSHRYQHFGQIDPPGAHGENVSNSLRIEWKRCKSELLMDFINIEIKAVKSVNPDVPVNTNLMEYWDAN
jgi:beta-galactosidase